jgi:hypothetical protein
MLERLALPLGQATPFTLLIGEPSQADERIAGEPLIGNLVDPLSGTALRHRAIGSSPYEDEGYSGQREGKFPHGPCSSTVQIQFHALDDIATMTRNCGVAKNDLLSVSNSTQ